MNEQRAQRPRFFDAHCDTFLQVVEKSADFEQAEDLEVTLPGMLQAGMGAQVFAAWTLAERLKGREDDVALQIVEAVGAMCRDTIPTSSSSPVRQPTWKPSGPAPAG